MTTVHTFLVTATLAFVAGVGLLVLWLCVVGRRA